MVAARSKVVPLLHGSAMQITGRDSKAIEGTPSKVSSTKVRVVNMSPEGEPPVESFSYPTRPHSAFPLRPRSRSHARTPVSRTPQRKTGNKAKDRTSLTVQGVCVSPRLLMEAALTRAEEIVKNDVTTEESRVALERELTEAAQQSQKCMGRRWRDKAFEKELAEATQRLKCMEMGFGEDKVAFEECRALGFRTKAEYASFKLEEQVTVGEPPAPLLRQA